MYIHRNVGRVGGDIRASSAQMGQLIWAWYPEVYIIYVICRLCGRIVEYGSPYGKCQNFAYHFLCPTRSPPVRIDVGAYHGKRYCLRPRWFFRYLEDIIVARSALDGSSAIQTVWSCRLSDAAVRDSDSCLRMSIFIAYSSKSSRMCEKSAIVGYGSQSWSTTLDGPLVEGGWPRCGSGYPLVGVEPACLPQARELMQNASDNPAQ